MSKLHWSHAYVGIPWQAKGRNLDGCDCWGLVALVHKVHFGVSVPSYTEDYSSPDEAAELDALISAQAASLIWIDVSAAPQEGDVMIFREGRSVRHAGIYINDSHMLHMDAEDHSRVVRHDMQPWSRRKAGIYRWWQR